MKNETDRKKSRMISVLAAASLLLMTRAWGDDDAPLNPPTFNRDVLPILQKNCQSCHRPGGDNYTGMVAPMPLVSYEDTRPWVKAIVRETADRKMPPWHASPASNGVFSNERGLTDGQIELLRRWAQSGAPQGDPADAPPAAVFPDFKGWRIGDPDLVVNAPRFFVKDEIDTLYISHKVKLTDEQLPESRWIKAIEWKGGTPVVHHIVGFAIAPGGKGGRGMSYGLGSIAPGEEPMVFPDGHAKLLVKGSTILFSMHYHKEKGAGTGMWDESQVAFKFYPPDANIEHFVEHNGVASSFFELPPGVDDWTVGAGRTFTEAVKMIALHPHMHLRGKDARFIAHYPDGSTEELIHVPRWDFNWQTDYSFKTPKLLPAGTRLEYTAHFDNSVGNAANPDPSSVVRPGQRTTDEMMIGFITYAAAEPCQLTPEGVAEKYLSAGGFEVEDE